LCVVLYLMIILYIFNLIDWFAISILSSYILFMILNFILGPIFTFVFFILMLLGFRMLSFYAKYTFFKLIRFINLVFINKYSNYGADYKLSNQWYVDLKWNTDCYKYIIQKDYHRAQNVIKRHFPNGFDCEHLQEITISKVNQEYLEKLAIIVDPICLISKNRMGLEPRNFEIPNYSDFFTDFIFEGDLQKFEQEIRKVYVRDGPHEYVTVGTKYKKYWDHNIWIQNVLSKKK
jgi:hypothetical protein